MQMNGEKHKNIKVISTNIALRENYFRLRCGWYLTPSKLHQMFLKADKKCWRCKKEIGTLIHIQCWTKHTA